MSELFGREASVQIGTLALKGFDISGRIEKSTKSEPNTCELTIYNLNEEHRAFLEELEPLKGATVGIPTKIEAGYKDATSVIWLGDLRTVESFYERPDWVTVVGSGDGERAYQTARINEATGPGVTATAVLTAISRALGVGSGNVAKAAAELEAQGFSANLAHGVVISGQASKQLTEWTRSAGMEWSIQDGNLQILKRGSAVPGTALRLASGTGLIGSPTVDNEGILTAKMQMIPDVLPGSLVYIDSKRIKGAYRIERAVWDFDTFGGPWEITIEAKRY